MGNSQHSQEINNIQKNRKKIKMNKYFFPNMQKLWPLRLCQSGSCWIQVVMLSTLGKLRAAWRIFFLCPGSVIPTSLRSWSSITLLPCVWRNFKRHKQTNHVQTYKPLSHTRMCNADGVLWYFINMISEEFFTVCQEFHQLPARLFPPHVILYVTHNCA